MEHLQITTRSAEPLPILELLELCGHDQFYKSTTYYLKPVPFPSVDTVYCCD